MTTQTAATVPLTVFGAREWRTLCALRMRYRQDRDLFNDRELAHLRFLRWLSQTGRLVP